MPNTLKQKFISMLNEYTVLRKKVLPYYLYKKNEKRLKNKIIPNLKKQLFFADSTPRLATHYEPTILIPYIETSHYCLYLMLIIGKALQLRGAKVNFLYCDNVLSACERISIHSQGIDVCRECRMNQEKLLPLYNLNSIKLGDLVSSQMRQDIQQRAKSICADYPEKFDYFGINLIPMVDDSVLRYFYGGSARTTVELNEIRSRHMATAMISTYAAKEIKSMYKPDIILSLMFVYSAFQPYFDYYKQQGVRTVSLDMSCEVDSAVNISAMELYYSGDRFNNYLISRNNQPLNDNERDQLNQHLNNRYSGNNVYFKMTSMFDGSVDPRQILKINSAKKNIFLFPNLFWDVGVRLIGGLYPNVCEWVISTIDIVKENKDCHLYIKPHPIEKYNFTASQKSISDYIYEKFPVLPENVTIIDPGLKINTYKLLPYIDLGVLYSGTLGLELLLNNISVVIAGEAFYSRLGFCHEPKNINDYSDVLFSRKNQQMKANKELVELFAYFYFIKRVIPFDIMKPIYNNNNFEKYNIDSLDDLLPGKNYYLDHVCDCILHDKLPESWV